MAGSALPGCTSVAYRPGGRTLPAFYEDIERRTFRFFWETVNRKNGLVPDRWPTPAFCSIAAVGFALPAYADRGRARLVHAGRSARPDADDARASSGTRRRGRTERAPPATRASSTTSSTWRPGSGIRTVELSSVDTTILLMGILFAGQYFDRDDAAEREIRRLARCDLRARRLELLPAPTAARRSRWAGIPETG